MKGLALVLKFIPLGFSALLPVVNPIGSAMLFLGLVGRPDHAIMKSLARKVSINATCFLLVVQLSGGYILRFFGISLPIVQVAGGLVLASMGWTLLNKENPEMSATAAPALSLARVEDKLFYPLTFPITIGPGCIVVALTLSARASVRGIMEIGLAHLGLAIGTVLVGLIVYFCYGYADRITTKLSPAASQAFLRIMAFILLCIGSEIVWNGIESLIDTRV